MTDMEVTSLGDLPVYKHHMTETGHRSSLGDYVEVSNE